MANNVRQQSEGRRLSFARRGLGWGAMTGAVWGLDGVVLGIALAAAPFTNNVSLFVGPLVGAALHDGFATLWLLIYNALAGKLPEIYRTLRVRPGLVVCLAALAGGPIGMTGYLLGIKHAGAAYAMAVSAIYPAVGSLLAVIFLKERISPRAWIGIALCVCGAIIVGYTPPDAAMFPHFKLGIAMAVLAALGWGGESVISAHGMDLVDPEIAINIREGVSFLSYLLVVIPLVGGYGMMRDALIAKPPLLIAGAGLCGAVAYLVWYKSLNMAGVGRGMALSITYVLWAIIYSAILTKYEITPHLIVGAVFVFLGALLIVAKPSELLSLRATDEPAEAADA
jgi:drug/metabolite transporter (DMT)-like permease